MVEEFDIKNWPRKLMDELDEMVVVVSDGKIKWVNRKFEEMIGRHQNKVVAKYLEDFVNGNKMFSESCHTEVSIKQVFTKFGQVLFMKRTNGFEQEVCKFNTIADENRLTLTRITKLCQKTQKTAQQM